MLPQIPHPLLICPKYKLVQQYAARKNRTPFYLKILAFMSLLLNLKLAIRCIVHQRSGRFAGFIAALSVIGIAIGVAALITVSSVMQSLQGRLKDAVLSSTPHLAVAVSPDRIKEMLSLPHVVAAIPFICQQAVLRSGDDVALVDVQGLDPEGFISNNDLTASHYLGTTFPTAGSYDLIADAAVFNRFNLGMEQKIKLISTINARYTPAGLTPISRNFTLVDFQPSLRDKQVLNAEGNLEDVRRLFRIAPDDIQVRLWLDDPMNVDATESELKKMDLGFDDWRSQQGEFFRSVAMEKLSMTVMLFLIVIVAAFNILSALSMSVSARIRDIAVLKTLGMSSGRIMQVFLMQGMLLGGGGAVIGTVLGTILALNSNMLLTLLGVPSGNNLPIALSVSWIVTIAVCAIVLSLLCTLYPAYKAAQADPASNLTAA